MSKDIYRPDHYLNEAGQDLFEEWYTRYPFEVFRNIMWCTAERYYRRYYRKNGLEDLNKGMRVMDRLKEYEERYSNEKYDKFSDESYLANQDMSSMYPPSTQEWSGYDPTSKPPTIPEYMIPEKGDVEIFRTNYYKETDVLEAVYKGLQDVLTEDGSLLGTSALGVPIYGYDFATYAVVEGLKEAIYNRLDALEKAYSILHCNERFEEMD